jgi:hypothetical protein
LGFGRNYWTKCEPFLSKILADLCVAKGDAQVAIQNEQAAKKFLGAGGLTPRSSFPFTRWKSLVDFLKGRTEN